MPMTPEEQDRFDALMEFTELSVAAGERLPVLSPAFVASMIAGHAGLRDRIDDLEAERAARTITLTPGPVPSSSAVRGADLTNEAPT